MASLLVSPHLPLFAWNLNNPPLICFYDCPDSDPENDASFNVPRITDEWGEEVDSELEIPSVPDPPQIDDECGRELDLGKFYELRNGSPMAETEEDDSISLDQDVISMDLYRDFTQIKTY